MDEVKHNRFVKVAEKRMEVLTNSGTVHPVFPTITRMMK